MAKVLVTGGTGFIGSHAVRQLLHENHEVVVLAHSKNFKNLGDCVNDIKFVQGDFGDPFVMDEVLDGVDVVVHLAWSSYPENSSKNPIYDLDSNIVSGLRMLDACVKHGVRKVVFISSGGTVYGQTQEEVIKEEHALNPISAYGISKMSFEKYLGFYKNQYGLDYTVLRVANAYGSYQNLERNQGVIGKWLQHVKEADAIEVWGDGSIIRDYVYVGDVAKAITLFVENLTVGVFNIGSGEGHSLTQILVELEKLLPDELTVSYKEGRKFDVQKNVLCIEKASVLGWKPEVSLSEGIKNTWEWLNSESR